MSRRDILITKSQQLVFGVNRYHIRPFDFTWSSNHCHLEFLHSIRAHRKRIHDITILFNTSDQFLGDCNLSKFIMRFMGFNAMRNFSSL